MVSAFRIEEMAVPHVEHKLVFCATGDGSVGIEAPDHGLAGDVNMHDEFVAHDLDEQYRASDDIVRLGVRAFVQQVFRSYAEINVFVHVGLHCGRFVRWQGQPHPASRLPRSNTSRAPWSACRGGYSSWATRQ